MAWSPELAQAVREALAGEEVTERRMFGGLTFMVDGHMCCGVQDNRMMVRVGPDAYDSCLDRAGVRSFDVTGRPLAGMIWIDPDALRSQAQIGEWVDRGVSFVRSLPRRSRDR